MTKPLIAVCIPSRGLIHSRTIEAVINNLRGKNVRLLFSHNLPIPACFNNLVDQALDLKADYLWFVEEDMGVEPDLLDRMLEADAPVVTVDYPVTAEGKSSVRYQDGEVWYCGTGCLLVQASVFKGLRFSSNYAYTKDGAKQKLKYPGNSYGGHDVAFCFDLQARGIPIMVISGKVVQYRAVGVDRPLKNEGCYEIDTWRLSA